MAAENVDELVKNLANTFGRPIRSPTLHWPDEYGLEYENVTFPSLDGVPLDAWFIPYKGSDKIVVCNHPIWFNRYGLASHLEPWKQIGDAGGNDFEVNFMPDYKHLHDAGYNVLTYDMRNFGHSGIGNATYIAMTNHPEYFRDVRCMVNPQPVSLRPFYERITEILGIEDQFDAIDREIQLITSFRIDDMSPVEYAKNCHVPTFVAQVHDDALTKPGDVQTIFDNIPTEEKKLHWIHGTTRRWDGYLFFPNNPDPLIEWFDKYMN